jgi:hypothetical protein
MKKVVSEHPVVSRDDSMMTRDLDLIPIAKNIDMKRVRIDMKELPKSVLSYDLKQMQSFKVKRRSFKFATQSRLFVEELSVVLSQYAPEEHQFDMELLTTVLNIAESFFIHGSSDERKAQKDAAVQELLLPYFRDDKDLLDLMKTSVWNKVKKSNVWRRSFRKFRNFFF